MALREIYGAWPLAPTNISWPCAGMWYRWTHLEGLSGAVSRVIHVAGMLLLSLQVVLSIALVFFRANRLWLLVALAGAVLAILGGTGIYENGWSYSRVFLWMPLGIWLASLEMGRRWPALLLTAAALWPVAAIAQRGGGESAPSRSRLGQPILCCLPVLYLPYCSWLACHITLYGPLIVPIR